MTIFKKYNSTPFFTPKRLVFANPESDKRAPAEAGERKEKAESAGEKLTRLKGRYTKERTDELLKCHLGQKDSDEQIQQKAKETEEKIKKDTKDPDELTGEHLTEIQVNDNMRKLYRILGKDWDQERAKEEKAKVEAEKEKKEEKMENQDMAKKNAREIFEKFEKMDQGTFLKNFPDYSAFKNAVIDKFTELANKLSKRGDKNLYKYKGVELDGTPSVRWSDKADKIWEDLYKEKSQRKTTPAEDLRARAQKIIGRVEAHKKRLKAKSKPESAKEEPKAKEEEKEKPEESKEVGEVREKVEESIKRVLAEYEGLSKEELIARKLNNRGNLLAELGLSLKREEIALAGDLGKLDATYKSETLSPVVLAFNKHGIVLEVWKPWLENLYKKHGIEDVEATETPNAFEAKKTIAKAIKAAKEKYASKESLPEGIKTFEDYAKSMEADSLAAVKNIDQSIFDKVEWDKLRDPTTLEYPMMLLAGVRIRKSGEREVVLNEARARTLWDTLHPPSPEKEKPAEKAGEKPTETLDRENAPKIIEKHIMKSIMKYSRMDAGEFREKFAYAENLAKAALDEITDYAKTLPPPSKIGIVWVKYATIELNNGPNLNARVNWKASARNAWAEGVFKRKAEAAAGPTEPPKKPAEAETSKKGPPPNEASDEQKTTAREAFTAGVEAFDKEDHQLALNKFKESYATIGHPATHLNIVQTLVKLKRYEEAKREVGALIRELEKAVKNDEKLADTLTNAREAKSEIDKAIAEKAKPAPKLAEKGAPIDKATPEQKKAATEKYLTGVTAFDKKNYEVALTEFKASYAIVASPNSHWMIVRSLIELERYGEALLEGKALVPEAEEAAKSDQKYASTAEQSRQAVKDLETGALERKNEEPKKAV